MGSRSDFRRVVRLGLLLGLSALTGPTLAAPPGASAKAAPAPVVRSAPEPYRQLVLRLGAGEGPLFDNVLYEGNNMAMRGALDGDAVAQRWRRAAAVGKPIFVLRDALFSQPDHPIEQRPYALMMPPSWVTAAADDVAAGRALEPLSAPDPEDDAAWQAIASARAMFGSFPASDRLYALAHAQRGADASKRRQIEHARASVRSLALDVASLIAAAPQGYAAVARAGAERIMQSDVRYFGVDGRRNVILIAVENPSRHELEDEGKGIAIAGRAVPQAILDIVRTMIYGQRLLAGDLALERYDLSRPDERVRAIRVLEALVPRDGRGAKREIFWPHDVWLWVNGGLDAQGIGGHDATPYVAAFREELGRANVDTSVVHLLSKPHVQLPAGDALRPALLSALTHYGQLDLPLSVNFDGRVLARLLRTP